MSLTLIPLSRRALPEAPSASAIERLGGHVLVIGDDGHYVAVLDPRGAFLARIDLYAPENIGPDGRIPKPLKRDLEASVLIPGKTSSTLLVFGSGSTEKREVVFEVTIPLGVANYSTPDTWQIQVCEHDLAPLYAKFREALAVKDPGAELKIAELNIEGATIYRDDLLLFNRGVQGSNNTVFSVRCEDFRNHLENRFKFPPPPFTSHAVALPQINGVSAGFSGATTVNVESNSWILFSATAENTTNSYDDGETVGSAIGVLDLSVGAASPKTAEITPREWSEVRESSDGALFRGKIESLTESPAGDEVSTRILCVTDNDGAPSELLEIEIKVS